MVQYAIMPVSQRLAAYYDFDPNILDRLDTVAADQNAASGFQELADRYDIADGPTKVLPGGAKKPIEVLAIGGYATEMQVLHLPMGNPVDTNMAMRGLRLYGVTERPLLLVGNPAKPGRGVGGLAHDDWRKVATGDLRPTVDPLFRHLREAGVRAADHLGYSYGADKAVTAAQYGGDYNVQTARAVAIETAALFKRNLAVMGLVFASTNKHTKEYAEQAASVPYRDARKSAASVGIYALGLLRPSNIAIAASLARDGFADRARAALIAQEDLRMAIGWGSADEFGNDKRLPGLVDELQHEAAFGERVSAMRLKGMHHAGSEDIDLHAAVMVQGLQQTDRPELAA